jgi:molecular chaperone GrpE
MDREPVTSADADGLSIPADDSIEDRQLSQRPAPQPQAEHQEAADEEGKEVWRDRALRLQAEIENFRKRQQRLAEERIVGERKRLLGSFLDVADDLERALAAGESDVESLRQGVALTHRRMMRALDQAGVERIDVTGQPFDPAWHEAVATVSHQQVGAAPDTVVEVVQQGYQLDDGLLRPARVVVAT